jgi:hypothetical protein
MKIHALAECDAAEACDRAHRGDGIRGGKRDLAGRAERADAETGAPCHTQPDLVRETEFYASVRKDHLDVRAGYVLEELHVDALVLHLRRKHASQGPYDLLRLAAPDPPLAHHFLDACRLGFQLEEDEEAAEDRDFDFLLAEEFAHDPPLLLTGRGAASIDQQLLECPQVDVEIEAVVRLIRDDHLDLNRIDPHIVRTLQ